MKFRAVHIYTNPEFEREIRSFDDVSKLESYDIEYIPFYSALYTGEIPLAREANDRPFVLTPAHYGCYRAHKTAILNYLTTDVDALLIFECDAIFSVGVKEMSQKIER